nr:HU family DNA-binding protein [uncultured Carboxylicivirga sp.]
MAIEITSKIFKNSLNKATKKPKYYPSVAHAKKIEFEKLCDDISSQSSLNAVHIQHVLLALRFQIENYLENGYRVELPGIGIFFPSVTGVPSNTPEEVNKKKIKNIKLHFRPANNLKKALQRAPCKMVSKK